MILELARYPLWSELVPIVCAGPTGSFRSSSPRPPAPRRAFFVATFSFGYVQFRLRSVSPKAGFGLSQSSRALGRRPSETGHFYVWGPGLCIGLRSLFAEPEESGRRTGSSEEPVHLLPHRVENLLERRLVIDRLRAASELPLGLAREPGVAQTRLRLIIIDSGIPGRMPRAPWLEAVASERLAFFSHKLLGGAALSGDGLSAQLYFGRGTSGHPNLAGA
ncbi:hypothetical protein GGP46_003439 [Salinibacter ruber]|nr:hypothetical protein [Salinibacter ruber]